MPAGDLGISHKSKLKSTCKFSAVLTSYQGESLSTTVLVIHYHFVHIDINDVYKIESKQPSIAHIK